MNIHAGLFYYNLGNLHPKYRSSLDSIQLLAVALVSDIQRYGVDAILEPIVEEVKALEKVSTNAVVAKIVA